MFSQSPNTKIKPQNPMQDSIAVRVHEGIVQLEVWFKEGMNFAPGQGTWVTLPLSTLDNLIVDLQLAREQVVSKMN